MNSALPHVMVSPSSVAMMLSLPAMSAMQRLAPRTYEMQVPSGERRTSKTPGAMSGSVTTPEMRLTCTMHPPRTVTAFVTEASHAYVTTPPAPSRARSRRRSSSAVNCERSAPTVRGSRICVSAPVAVLKTQSELTES